MNFLKKVFCRKKNSRDQVKCYMSLFVIFRALLIQKLNIENMNDSLRTKFKSPKVFFNFKEYCQKFFFKGKNFKVGTYKSLFYGVYEEKKMFRKFNFTYWVWIPTVKNTFLIDFFILFVDCKVNKFHFCLCLYWLNCLNCLYCLICLYCIYCLYCLYCFYINDISAFDHINSKK